MKPRLRFPIVSRYSTAPTSHSSSSSYPPSSGPSPSKVRFIPISGTYPKNFLVAGIHAGVKKNPRLLDLAVITSRTPINAAAVFTTNAFQAAPVLVCKRVLETTGGSGIGGLVVNSGCANAVTGEGGLKDAESMAGSLKGGNALVMSTGVIGQRLPIEKIMNGIPVAVEKVGDTHQHWLDAATAFCTTDTFPKLLSRDIQTEGGSYRIAGIAKGAGMIHPKFLCLNLRSNCSMATLLSSLFTDAPISPPLLRSVLLHAVERSFNAISVDGDMSTNDTLSILANGAASIPEITGGKALDQFRDVVTEFAEELAKLVIWDGEGATKFVTIKVKVIIPEAQFNNRMRRLLLMLNKLLRQLHDPHL
jgi:glutamate N-acetyltransferase / amino-acid N-acetyltransferase